MCLSLRPESMASIMSLSPRKPVAQGLTYFEMPKSQMNLTESRPERTLPSFQRTLPPFTLAPKLNPDGQDYTSAPVNEPLVKPGSHLSMMSIQLGHSTPQAEPAQHIQPLTPTNPQHTPRPLQVPVLPQIATTSDTKPIDGAGVAHKKEAVTVDLG